MFKEASPGGFYLAPAKPGFTLGASCAATKQTWIKPEQLSVLAWITLGVLALLVAWA